MLLKKEFCFFYSLEGMISENLHRKSIKELFHQTWIPSSDILMILSLSSRLWFFKSDAIEATYTT